MNNDVQQYSDEAGADATTWQDLPPEREFFATPYDPPIKSLVDEIRTQELIVRPSFQRNRVWDRSRQSKFVESILLNIPIPTLFFAEDDDKTKVVVDGQQRLLALKDFLENQYPLRNLEVLPGLIGKRFDDLTERQQRIIRNRTLRCLVISARSDSEIRFQVFERLNQGGVPLNAQEVRHCVYRGELNDLLHELVTNKTWLSLYGSEAPHTRMVDRELVLRFFAIRDALPEYKPPLKTLLNNFMRSHRHPDREERDALQSTFESAVAAVAAVFSDHPFRRLSKTDNGPTWDRNVNRAVLDVQLIVMEGMELEWLNDNQKAVQDEFMRLCLEDSVFADAISRATADKSRLEYRLRTWANGLHKMGAAVPALHRIPPEQDSNGH